MNDSPSSFVREMATFAYFIETDKGTPKIPGALSTKPISLKMFGPWDDPQGDRWHALLPLLSQGYARRSWPPKEIMKKTVSYLFHRPFVSSYESSSTKMLALVAMAERLRTAVWKAPVPLDVKARLMGAPRTWNASD